VTSISGPFRGIALELAASDCQTDGMNSAVTRLLSIAHRPLSDATPFPAASNCGSGWAVGGGAYRNAHRAKRVLRLWTGEGIIPYPCDGGFANMEFNFVDQGGGFYSIHTVNGAMGLCLNISNATASPGDGKTLGGPGNLIQWTCSDGPLPDNELFKVVAVGGNRLQIRIKSSGLCLEDPGRGGTLRQNLCNPSLGAQDFILTD
jgi:hypothetical protein